MEEKTKSEIAAMENLTEELKTATINNVKVRVNGMLLTCLERFFFTNY